MGKHDTLAKSLAVVGTVLVILPLLAPFVLGLGMMGTLGGFRLDYLMPFEIYPVTVAGAALLVWAAFRAHARRGAVAVAIAVMFGALVLATISAQVTGIANSPEQLETWKYVLTSTLAGISLAAQIALASIGVLLSRDLLGKHQDNAPPLSPATGA
jgi:hypothetical protein